MSTCIEMMELSEWRIGKASISRGSSFADSTRLFRKLKIEKMVHQNVQAIKASGTSFQNEDKREREYVDILLQLNHGVYFVVALGLLI